MANETILKIKAQCAESDSVLQDIKYIPDNEIKFKYTFSLCFHVRFLLKCLTVTRF